MPGGFAGVYRVLSAFEDAGRVRRGYFVEGLGAAQFSTPGAVDRLRAIGDGAAGALVVAAADPANPYGAALPWPERSQPTPGSAAEADEPEPASAGRRGQHKPGRKAGALVVLHGGEPGALRRAGWPHAAVVHRRPRATRRRSRRPRARRPRGGAGAAHRRAGRRGRAARVRPPARRGARRGRLPHHPRGLRLRG
nr:hypothetical protein [Angustibacter aerolatus]